LKSHVASLERQVFYLLLVLIIVSGTLTAFLYRQTSDLGKKIRLVTPQVEKMRTVMSQNHESIDAFLNQLGAYGQVHPDFQRQILSPNGLPPAGTAGVPPIQK